MLELYSGTPGSGKSYHATERIYYSLLCGRNIIANFPVTMPKTFRKVKGEFLYLPNEQLTVNALMEFAKKFHKGRKEGQTLIVIDEAGIKFNARSWQDKDRFQWLNFFSQHRKFGFDIILISQADIMLDKQMRTFIEIEHNHRKMKNCGRMGFLLSPIMSFVDVKFWYGIKLRLGMESLRYSKKIANIYDSYALFDTEFEGALNE